MVMSRYAIYLEFGGGARGLVGGSGGAADPGLSRLSAGTRFFF